MADKGRRRFAHIVGDALSGFRFTLRLSPLPGASRRTRLELLGVKEYIPHLNGFSFASRRL